jgi:hypothetical protein
MNFFSNNGSTTRTSTWARLSYEKLYDLLAVRLIKARDLAELATFDPDPRRIARDR